MSEAQADDRRWLWWLLPLMALFVWRLLPSFDTLVDDAFISARYAQHFAEGHGLVYNAGEPPVEGYTNLLWTVLLGIGLWAGLPAHGLMAGMSAAFGALALAGGLFLSAALSPRRPGVAVGVGMALLAASPDFAVSSSNGLESTMFVAAVLWTLWAHATQRIGLTAALAASLFLIRPEGIAVAGLVSLHALWRAEDKRAGLRVGLWVTGVAVAVTAWRLATYGAWLPNTYAAKSSFPLTRTFLVNDDYLERFGRALLGWCVTGFAAAAFVRGSMRWLLLALLALLWFVPMTVNLWMPGLRLFLPAIGIGLAALGGVLAGTPRRWQWVALVAALPIGIGYDSAFGPRARKYDQIHSVLPDNPASLAARHLAEHAPEGAWLATRDAGVLAFYVGTGVTVAELHQRALTQPHPHGLDAKVRDYTPQSPTFFAGTVRTEKDERFAYGSDKQVFERMRGDYDYLGRVRQHHRRHYDIYARAEVGVPPMPKAWIASRNGPRKGAPTPARAERPRRPLKPSRPETP